MSRILSSPRFQLGQRSPAVSFNPTLHRESSRFLNGWVTGGGLLLALTLWQWQLVAAIAAGISVAVVVYLSQLNRLYVSWKYWHQVWSRANRPLTLAIISGVVSASGTYVIATQTIQLSWLAAGIVLQGVGTVSLGGALLWHLRRSPQPQSPQSSVSVPQRDHTPDQILAALADSHPLKRLVAVRQAVQWGKRVAAASATATDEPVSWLDAPLLCECFRLMLRRESDPVVRRALCDGLKQLEQPASQREGRSLKAMTTRSLSLPMTLRQPVSKVTR